MLLLHPQALTAKRVPVAPRQGQYPVPELSVTHESVTMQREEGTHSQTLEQSQGTGSALASCKVVGDPKVSPFPPSPCSSLNFLLAAGHLLGEDLEFLPFDQLQVTVTRGRKIIQCNHKQVIWKKN